jgi:hypothetical protein
MGIPDQQHRDLGSAAGLGPDYQHHGHKKGPASLINAGGRLEPFRGVRLLDVGVVGSRLLWGNLGEVGVWPPDTFCQFEHQRRIVLRSGRGHDLVHPSGAGVAGHGRYLPGQVGRDLRCDWMCHRRHFPTTGCGAASSAWPLA